MKISLEELKVSFDTSEGFGLKFIKSYEDLKQKKLPFIFDIHSCAEIIITKAEFLRKIIQNTSNFYRTFEIPKKSGGVRLIETPIPSLLKCQKWISEYILQNIYVHDSATAYRKKMNILKNVELHLAEEHLLKIDLKDFFHSISIQKVINCFKDIGYIQDAAMVLAKICCHQNRLSQGAATSPILSNIIARKLDNRLYGLSKKYGLNYTRYSDDITFSGKYIHKNILLLIEKIITEEGFLINHKKTRLYVKKGKRIITGISVSQKTPKIPRDKKRAIKQEVHELLKNTNIEFTINNSRKNVFFLESLKGKLHFWCHIEKDATFPRMALKKLKEFETISDDKIL